jgi:hypothetical protein
MGSMGGIGGIGVMGSMGYRGVILPIAPIIHIIRIIRISPIAIHSSLLMLASSSAKDSVLFRTGDYRPVRNYEQAGFGKY